MKRDNFTMPLDLGRELIIDNFAGGGGTSEGLEQAFGRPVDVAINHDPEALAMHALNHPHTLHLCESVWEVDPIKVTKNQPVALVWLSPDCKHFSKAKGGTPVAKHIRGLAWVGMRWVALTKPRVLMLENVEEFQDWGPLIVDAEGNARPDPAKKGKTFQSFVRQLRAHGYAVDWRELRACDAGAPTIRKRLFLIARRDGRPIVWPRATHGEPTSKAVLAGQQLPWRTAAECIDFSLPAQSVFGRPRALAENTQRRVAKGLWRHVLTSASPFIVGVGGRMGQSPARSVQQPAQTITSKADSCVAQPQLQPYMVNTRNGERPGQDPRVRGADQPYWTVTGQGSQGAVAQPVVAPFITEHAQAANQRTMPVDEPLRTLCAQVKGGHFSVVAPALAPMRGTSPAHMGGHSVQDPLSTISAQGTHHGLMAARMAPFVTGLAHGLRADGSCSGDRSHTVGEPLRTIHAGGGNQAVTVAHLVDMGHGEGKDGGKRFSHGVRSLEVPLNTVTASGATSALAAVHLTHLTHHGERSGYSPAEPAKTITGANRGEQALVAACLEQANGGFYDGDGRSVDAPVSTITASGTQQRLITAYAVKYYSSGGQWQALDDPMHTLPTKGRMGLVQTMQVPAACLAPEHAERARQCAQLLHRYLPEQFAEPADMVLVFQQGQWWVLVDITLRMLKPRELFNAQGFPAHYVIDEIPDPKRLFVGGIQAEHPLQVPRVPLSATAQVRMCGNSVSPPQARALVEANFAHELQIYGEAA
jgi:DNA (cytosine-5)-methyltransferase 1